MERIFDNHKNKLPIVNLLANHIKSGRINKKGVIVNKGSECFLVTENGSNWARIPELNSTHREADQKIPMHAVYAGQNSNETVCVVADDMDIYLSLINISHHVSSHLYFRQGKAKDKVGISYLDIHAIAAHLGDGICRIIPAFHTLRGSDFTNQFFNRSKIKAFKKMLKTPNCY